jgi:DNA-directed RNA polymerase specialized sigma24 family protein
MKDDTHGSDSPGVQQEALARLDRAVAEFKAAEALQALHDSNVLAGLQKRLHIRCPCLRNEHDTHHVIANGVDALTDELENGRRVTDPLGFLWRVIERRANDEVRRKRRETPTDPQVMVGRVLPVLPADLGPAIQEARRLLPRIRGDNARSTLEMILKAMEQGRQTLPSSEIAETLGVTEINARQLRRRAFERLLRLAREEQAAGKGFDLPELWDDEEELLVAPDGADEDDED